MSNLEKNSPKKDEARGATGQHTGQNNGQFLQATTDSIYPKHAPSQVGSLIVTPTQDDLLRAMGKLPELTDYGVGIYAPHLLTPQERIEEFQRERERLTTRLEMFQTCCYWLALCQRSKTIYPYRGSYGLKHDVENFFGVYVTNGAFIAAVIHSGIMYRVYPGRPNVGVGIGKKLPSKGAGINV